ncbi:MAG: NAD(P)H-binding protein, partial [Pseudomonadota bacterium]
APLSTAVRSGLTAMTHTALIAGVTGLVGGECLRRLLDAERYGEVIALTRRPLPIAHAKLRDDVVDFDRLAAVPKAEDVFCALGTTRRQAGSEAAYRKVDFEFPKRVAELALAAGAQRFVLVSSVGANAGSRNFYLRVKGELEAAVAAMPYEAVHIFQPSFLVGARTERRPAEAAVVILAQTLEFAMVGKLRRFRPIAAETLAAAMLASVRGDPGRHIYQYDEIKTLEREPGDTH